MFNREQIRKNCGNMGTQGNFGREQGSPTPLGGPQGGIQDKTRLESIVLVKLAYYAISTARFLSKLCSNYALFSKFCYFFSKLCSTKNG